MILVACLMRGLFLEEGGKRADAAHQRTWSNQYRLRLGVRVGVERGLGTGGESRSGSWGWEEESGNFSRGYSAAIYSTPKLK